ncbi:SusC/RagA family TonB-linked outer membrane protein [Parabacteroides sp. HGS0025]|uniref:TonB-dependent receptor n=1 Tax=Parabacteroides sp. HGS0025 TaxID=1078087 RepID=UPI0006171B73|nr:TonB-dependent receptor [Parabacteroides sp. HGS0025]KKB46344.1 SusC/RagA family TonB-linked outer membrane protein [Parabacteroides sp. HGS0025]
MKLSTFFFFLLIMQLHAENIQSQTASVALNKEALTLNELISEIESQTDYLFIYSKSDINVSRRVKVNTRSRQVSDILNDIFSDSDITYKFANNYISLRKINEKTATGNPDPAQTKKIVVTGKVLDSFGDPVIGANIVEDNTTNGTVSDIDGNFSLSVAENGVLAVTFIGYIEQKIPVKNKTSFTIKLNEDLQKLDEVIVVGYGSMKKSDLTGSVVSLKAEEINSPNNSSLVQMMQGRAAGVVITQNSTQPGGAADVRIRGLSSVNASKTPLYVVDGFPVDNTNFYPGSGDVFDGPKKDPLNSINPSDIESMEVLKDASATAIYGSRAANGVILITTKQGKEGKAKVTLNSSFGIQTIAKRFEFLDGSEFGKVTNEMFSLYNKNPYYTNDEIAAFGKGTNWLDEVTHTGMVTNHDLSLQGGTASTKYMVSASYHLNNGIVKESSFERYSFRVNLEQKISSLFSVNISSFMSNTSDKNVAVGTRAEDTGVLSGAYTFPSNVPVRDENGKFSKNPRYALLPNPVSLLDIDDKTRSKRSMLNASLNITPTDYLFIKLQAGTDMQDSKREYYNPKTTRNGADANGIASVTATQGRSNLFEGTATFKKEFNKVHKLDIMAGYTYQDFTYEELTAKVSNFFTDYFGYNNIGIGETYSAPGTTKRMNKLLSGVARVNYNFADRYLFTATFRADGSSKFDKEHRFGYFPSFSAAWRISNEEFMKGLTSLSNMKLRLGYGETGNQDIGNNSYQNLLKKGYEYVFGNSPVTTIIPGNAGNPLLMWETAKQFNIGLDMGFFNNRVSGTLEYYQINTDNLLLQFSTPAYSGYTSQWRNAGEIINRGVEFTLNTTNIRTRNFQWETLLTVSHNKNKWNDRAGLPKPYIGASENDPVNAIYGYTYDGIWQEGDDIKNSAQPNSVPGNIRFKDIGGRDADGNFVAGPDGKINDADISYLGTPDPKVELGFGNDLTYKNWNLNIFFNARLGGKKYNQFRAYYENPVRVYEGFNAFSSVMDRWTPTNTTSQIHSGAANPYGGDMNTFYVEDASFLRLKSVRLTYNTKIQSFPLSVYVDAQNLFTITGYSGYDPEIGGTNDYNTYPACRTFMAGLRISF